MYSNEMSSDDTTNKILRYGILAGIFLLPFIPFIISKGMFFPFITGKNFAFRIIVEIILAGWLILAWRDVQYRLKFSWILGTLAVFVGAVTVADIFGEDFFRSFWSNYERMDGLITLLHLCAFFVVGSSVMNTKFLWERFFQTSLGASILISIYSIFQLLGFVVINQGGVRIDATLGNATYLAGYLLFHIFFAAFLIVQKHNPRWLQYFYGGVILLHTIILFNTMTRGAILGLIGGAMTTALLLTIFNWNNTRVKKYTLGFLTGVVIFIGIFIAIKDMQFVRNNQILDRFASLSLDSGKSRFLVWSVAWEGVKENPVLGWGQDNYIIAFSKHYKSRLYSEEPWFDRAHNVVFDWLISAGALGLVSYLAVFFALLYAIWIRSKTYARTEEREHKFTQDVFSVPEKSILTGLIAAYLFHNLFVFDNVVSYIFFFSILALVHSAYSREPKSQSAPHQNQKTHDERTEFINRLIGPVVLIALIFSLYALNIKHILGNRALLNAIDMRAVQQLESQDGRESILREKLTLFEKSLRSGYLGRMETREQLTQAANALVNAPVSQIVKQEFFILANMEMGKQIEESPNNLRPRLFKASLHLTYQLFDETISEIEEAFKISDKKQDMYIMLASAYVNVGNLEKAIEIAQRGFELAEGNDRALKFYGTLLIRGGKTKEAEEILSALGEETYLSDPEIINAYTSVGKFEKLTSFLEGYVKQKPESLQAHMSLASVYIESKNRLKAVAILEQAVLRFPEFKEQGEFFIREIKAGRNP
ncbi:MAG: O-antigen ligase family protein [bacterium]|nr:O-antigen ligase family protein [bacterium]